VAPESRLLISVRSVNAVVGFVDINTDLTSSSTHKCNYIILKSYSNICTSLPK
jgi:hypothetical protein